jgi:gas vesicle protein
MTSKPTHTKEFLMGAVIGSLLGGVTLLLTAPTAGKKLRREINDLYDDFSDRGHEIADQFSKKSKGLMKSLGEQSHHFADKAKCLYCGMKNMVGCEEHEEEDSTKDLIIGGAIGGLLGALAGLVLAPKSGSELRGDIADTYESMSEKSHEMVDQVSKNGKKMVRSAKSKANKWVDFAKGLVDEWTDEVEEKGDEYVHQAKDKVNDLFDWAVLGYRVWQNINKKR